MDEKHAPKQVHVHRGSCSLCIRVSLRLLKENSRQDADDDDR